jgi:hypothetical protein
MRPYAAKVCRSALIRVVSASSMGTRGGADCVPTLVDACPDSATDDEER